MAIDPQRLRDLHDDVELRSEEAFRLAWEDESLANVDQVQLAQVIRVAYGCGYRDGVSETRGNGSSLLKRHHLRLAGVV